MTKSAFEGASTEYRLAQKGLTQGGSDKIAARELKLLRARSHHLCRNNAAAVTAKRRLQTHWIGPGIRVRWDNKRLQKLWDNWIKDPNLDGYGDLYTTEHIWAGACFESGEVFCRMVIQSDPKQPIPLKLQTLEAEFLDPLWFQPPKVRYGIEFDAFGKPEAYHLFQQDPYELGMLRQTAMRVVVPAQDLLHIFERTRPGQWRGIPHLAPVMLPLYEMDELVDATLVRQKAAQAIAWIIKKRDSGPAPSIGPVSGAASTVLDEDNRPRKRRKIQEITPGGVHYLEDDEDFEFADTQDIGNNLTALLRQEWQMISSGVDVTYEQMTGDLSQVNFSSLRAALTEFRRRVACFQQLILIGRGLKPLTERFRELAATFVSPGFAEASCKFVLPKTDGVDPLKDTQADLLEIQAGLATLEEKLAERGVEDFDSHILQLAKEQGLDVVLSSNPAKATKSTNPPKQAKPKKGKEDGNSTASS